MYVSFLATFHLTDFREKWKQYDMVLTYFNQQAPTVSVFRIYHTETHMKNIAKKIVNFSLEFRIKTNVQDQNKRSLQMIMKQNLDK